MSKFNVSKKIVLLLSLVSLAAGIFAEELNLEDIRRASVLSSAALKKLEISKQTQVLTRLASYFKYLPSLNAKVSASYPFLEGSASTVTLQNKPDAGAQFSLSENLSVTLFDGGKSRIEKSNLGLDESSLDARTSAQFFAVVEEADSRYFSYLEAAAAVKTAEMQGEISALALETAEIRRSSGILSQSDYFLALSDNSAADSSLAAAITGYSLAKSRLEHLTGISNIEDLAAVNFDNYEELLSRASQWSMEDISLLYEKLKNLLAARSPSLKSAYVSLKQAENSYALAKSAYYPTVDLSLSLSLGLNYSLTGQAAAKDPLSYDAALTLGGTIPLDYWVIANKVKQQKNSLESSQIDYAETLAAFDIELQSALFTIAGNARTLISSRRQAEYSGLLLEQQQELFRLSSTSMASFLDASSRAQSGETRKTQGEYAFLRSLSTLKTMGTFEDAELLLLLTE